MRDISDLSRVLDGLDAALFIGGRAILPMTILENRVSCLPKTHLGVKQKLWEIFGQAVAANLPRGSPPPGAQAGDIFHPFSKTATSIIAAFVTSMTPT
jgi:hypothetical protein